MNSIDMDKKRDQMKILRELGEDLPSELKEILVKETLDDFRDEDGTLNSEGFKLLLGIK